VSVDDVVALGIDWAGGRWVGVILGSSDQPVIRVKRDLRDLIALAGEPNCICIDMPIGLPKVEREADKLARKYVGCRRASVFMTPPRAALEAPDYEAAKGITQKLIGKKLTTQAWGLRHNIAVVEAIASCDPRIREVHPEVSFRALVGQELGYSKHSWNGQRLRRVALDSDGITFPDVLSDGGDVPVADVLDAGAAAWSARRVALHEGSSFPNNARAEQREVIWY
jgi:predicted RNase H-like nuclease